MEFSRKGRERAPRSRDSKSGISPPTYPPRAYLLSFVVA